MKRLTFRNLQRKYAVNLPAIRRIVRDLLERDFGLSDYDLGASLVSPDRMAKINERFLHHAGPTDVITFPYAAPPAVHGELLICPAMAESQAREFKTSRQSELIRYFIHGILHLRGFDDHQPAARRLMKREEDRLMRRVEGPLFDPPDPRPVRARSKSRRQ